MGFGSALLCILLGLFTIIYLYAQSYNCRVNGQSINAAYVMDNFGICATTYTNTVGVEEFVCCDSTLGPDIDGNLGFGLFYLFYGLFVLITCDPEIGQSLWFPNDTIWYQYRLSGLGIMHSIAGFAGLFNYVTALAGGCLLTQGLVLMYAGYRRECGDGGYFERKKKALPSPSPSPASSKEQAPSDADYSESYRSLIVRLYREDKLSTYFWLGLYILVNVGLYLYTLSLWFTKIELSKTALINGELQVDCNNEICKNHRNLIRYGPVSTFVPYAKAAGNCLNLNCAIVLLPVTKVLLNKINNAGISFHRTQATTDYFSKFFAHPLTRYVPLQKNLEFHKVIALAIFIFTIIHILFHLINLVFNSRGTLAHFTAWGWKGSYLFTGAVVTWAMFIIYPGALEPVRRIKFEIFHKSHLFYIIFMGFMLLHGPVFPWWSAIPIFWFLVEKYLETQRGQKPFIVTKVEWIEPVLAVYFRPINKVRCDVMSCLIIY